MSYRTHGPREWRRVALTFDDGPSDLTEQILEALAAGEARATFDVLGRSIAGREDALRRTLAAGHELGNHAYDHTRLVRRPLVALRQIRHTSRLVRDATGATPRVFRAPYGAVDRRVLLAARLAGMTVVGWDVDPLDWQSPGADAITTRVLDAVRPGSIVSLHDGRRSTAQTANALSALLPALRRRGYELVTVSELLG